MTNLHIVLNHFLLKLVSIKSNCFICNILSSLYDSPSRADKGRITLSKPDERTCQILLNSTLPVDKGTWKFTVEAGKGNESTFDQYDHILDVLVFGKNW